MKAHTQTFKENLTTLGKEITAKVTYTIDGVETELDGDTLGSVTPHYEGNILKSVMKQVDIMSDIDIPLNTEINVQFGMKYDDEEFEYIDYGNYIVYSSEKQEDTNNYKIIAYDKMLYAMKDYEQLLTINLFDKTSEPYKREYYEKSDGTDQYSTEFAIYKLNVEPNKTYTLINGGGSYAPGLSYFNEQDEYINGFNYNNTRTIVFTTPSNASYILYTVVVTNDNNRKDIDFFKIIPNDQTQNELVVCPITIKDYINTICSKIGLEFANSNEVFANYDKEIPSELYSNLGYTYRDVLDELAQVTASTICINDDDELEVRYINDTQGKNLFDYTIQNNWSRKAGWGTTAFNINDDIVNVNIAKNWDVFSLYNEQMIGKQISISCDIRTTQRKNDFVGVYFTESTYTTDNNRSTNIKSVENGEWVHASWSTTSTNGFIGFCFRGQDNSSMEGTTLIEIKNIIVNYGDPINYEPYGDTINEDYIKNTRASFGEKYGPINSIVLSRSAGSDNVYLQDEDSIEENGLCELKISDNQIMNGDNRSDFLPDLLEYLGGLEYYTNDFESIGITYLDLCDRYNIKIEDKFYNCIMFNDEVEIGDGLNEIIYTNKPEETQTDYKKATTTDKLKRQTSLIVDKQNERIEAIVGDVESDFASIRIDMNGIKSEVQGYDTIINEQGEEIQELRKSYTEQTPEMISDWFDTNLKATLDDLQNTASGNDEEIRKIKAYVRRGVITDPQSPYYNQAYIELGDETNQTTLRILQNRIQFLTNGQETAFISNNQLYINESTILTKEKVGHWVTTEDEDGLLNTYWED